MFRSIPTGVMLAGLALCTPALAQQGGVTHFCTPGANGATLGASGSADLGAQGGSGDLVLSAQDLPVGSLGIFLQGNASMPALPLGQGFLCVSGTPQIWRLGVVSTGATGTTVTQAIDYLNPPDPAAQIQAGDTWNFQLWFRAGATSDLTDALSIQFVPPVAMGPGTQVFSSSKSGHPLGQSFTGGALVLDDGPAFHAFWLAHSVGFTPAPPPPQVDFNQSTVIAVFSGLRLSTGYSISVSAVALSVSTVHVDTLELTPGLGCGVFFSETNPMQLVVVPKIGSASLGSWNPQSSAYTCP